MTHADQFRGSAGRALAGDVIETLLAHDIPVTAPNYQIWLAYRLGSHLALCRDIDAHIACGEAFSAEVCERLFEQHFANTRLSAKFVETSETLARELAEVVLTLRGAGAQATAYDDALQAVAADIDGETLDAGAFRALVAQLRASTRDMLDHNRELTAQMQQSSRQVETLTSTIQSIKVEALTDSLTGLANRRCFDDTLTRRLAEADTDARPLCLVMCDIDHFKRFNDSWGHLVGDQVIRFIGSVLMAHAPKDALAARYGGEEFALILPRCTRQQARAIADAIHKTVRSKKLSRRSTGEVIGAVTVSMGVAQSIGGQAATALIESADRCLYASKHAGRDRVTVDADAIASAA